MSERPERFRYRRIGVVSSPYADPKDLPPPAVAPRGYLGRIRGRIVVDEDLAPGLDGLEKFSHIIVIFAFHRAEGFKLETVPPLETKPRGIFATRSPHRPNGIGMSVLRLLGRRGRVLEVSGLDLIDGTPVLDIKPYTGRDRVSRVRTPRRGDAR